MAYDKFAAVDSSTLLFPPTVRANLAAVSPNYVINGGFDIWQRGTSFSSIVSNAFSADRWQTIYNGTGATRDVTQQVFSPGTAPVAGNGGQYFLRMAQTVAGTGGTYNVLSQKIEDVRTLAGQTVTYSFWAKADTARSVSLEMFQNFGTGGSSSVYASIGTVSLTTSWARYSLTYNVPSITGKTIGTNSNLQFQIALPLNVVQTIDIWGVQLEAGAVATPFRRNANSIQGELAACQRYYYRRVAEASVGAMCHAVGGSTTSAVAILHFPVNMRIAPTSVEYNPTLYLNSYVSSNGTISSISLNTTNTNTTTTCLDVSGTTITADKPYKLTANGSSTAYLGFSAEL